MGQNEGKGTSEGGEGGLIKEERWVEEGGEVGRRRRGSGQKKEGKWVEEGREGG